jgi:hypothetical protein
LAGSLDHQARAWLKTKRVERMMAFRDDCVAETLPWKMTMSFNSTPMIFPLCADFEKLLTVVTGPEEYPATSDQMNYPRGLPRGYPTRFGRMKWRAFEFIRLTLNV